MLPGATESEEEVPIAEHPVLDDHFPQARVNFPRGVVSLPDVVYSIVSGYRPLRMDLYLPASSDPEKPLIIFLHGGAWQGGHTRHAGAFDNWPGVLASIAARGFVVASAEYRLSGEARYPAAVLDVKSAVRWLRANATRYGIDSERVAIWGVSAGGQLAALVATTCGESAFESPAIAHAPGEPSDCVQRVVTWYGAFDFAHLVTTAPIGTGGEPEAASPEARYLGCSPGSCSSSLVRQASPIAHVDAQDPPMLLIHGVEDRTVPATQSQRMYAELKAKGVRTELVLIPGVDHSFIGGSPDATSRASRLALEKTLSFFDALAGVSSAPD